MDLIYIISIGNVLLLASNIYLMTRKKERKLQTELIDASGKVTDSVTKLADTVQSQLKDINHYKSLIIEKNEIEKSKEVDKLVAAKNESEERHSKTLTDHLNLLKDKLLTDSKNGITISLLTICTLRLSRKNISDIEKIKLLRQTAYELEGIESYDLETAINVRKAKEKLMNKYIANVSNKEAFELLEKENSNDKE